MVTTTTTSSRRKKEARAAVMARVSDKDFVKTTIHKSDQVRNLIYHSIKRNMLFRACSEEELHDLIVAFDTAKFKADSVVIKQGDEGDLFYVVETGKLDVTVLTGDSGASSPREIQVGVPYVSGSSFGELALMIGSNSKELLGLTSRKEMKSFWKHYERFVERNNVEKINQFNLAKQSNFNISTSLCH